METKRIILFLVLVFAITFGIEFGVIYPLVEQYGYGTNGKEDCYDNFRHSYL